jgi:hypothetical protein
VLKKSTSFSDEFAFSVNFDAAQLGASGFWKRFTERDTDDLFGTGKSLNVTLNTF